MIAALFNRSILFLFHEYTHGHDSKDAGAPALLRLDTPATCERIRMSCVDDISKAVTGGDNGFTVESFC